MQFRRLGRTGLEVSVLGLGTGGHSRLGQNTGVSEEDVRWLVHYALDSGVNFIDTAAAYAESEAILGRVFRETPISLPPNLVWGPAWPP